MKRYNLSADFVRWEGDAEHANEIDSFNYVIELESKEEAEVRLNSLIIDRISSKPGWNYKVINSGLSEFPEIEQKNVSQSEYEQALLSDQLDSVDLSGAEQMILPDPDVQPDNPEPEQALA